MNELVGALGLPGALAAIILALERGIALGRGFRNGKHANNVGKDLTEIRESIARIEAGFEARIAAQESNTAILREHADKLGSRIAARCEEIIDPLRQLVEHLETRVDGLARRR
jgi:hypothetical protein